MLLPHMPQSKVQLMGMPGGGRGLRCCRSEEASVDLDELPMILIPCITMAVQGFKLDCLVLKLNHHSWGK